MQCYILYNSDQLQKSRVNGVNINAYLLVVWSCTVDIAITCMSVIVVNSYFSTSHRQINSSISSVIARSHGACKHH